MHPPVLTPAPVAPVAPVAALGLYLSYPRPTAGSQQHLLGNFLGERSSALQSRGRTKTWNCPQPVRSSRSGPRTVGGFNPKPRGGGSREGGSGGGAAVAAPQTTSSLSTHG